MQKHFLNTFSVDGIINKIIIKDSKAEISITQHYRRSDGLDIENNFVIRVPKAQLWQVQLLTEGDEVIIHSVNIGCYNSRLYFLLHPVEGVISRKTKQPIEKTVDAKDLF